MWIHDGFLCHSKVQFVLQIQFWHLDVLIGSLAFSGRCSPVKRESKIQHIIHNTYRRYSRTSKCTVLEKSVAIQYSTVIKNSVAYKMDLRIMRASVTINLLLHIQKTYTPCQKHFLHHNTKNIVLSCHLLFSSRPFCESRRHLTEFQCRHFGRTRKNSEICVLIRQLVRTQLPKSLPKTIIYFTSLSVNCFFPEDWMRILKSSDAWFWD